MSIDLRAAVDHACEAIALNRAQHRALYNPSATVDSLAERVIALKAHGVPRHVVRALLRDVRRLMDLNARELTSERAVNGALGAAPPPALTIKALARALREPLRVLREPGADGTAYALAAIRVREVCDSQPAERLRCQALRHEVGAGPHDQLVELLTMSAGQSGD